MFTLWNSITFSPSCMGERDVHWERAPSVPLLEYAQIWLRFYYCRIGQEQASYLMQFCLVRQSVFTAGEPTCVYMLVVARAWDRESSSITLYLTLLGKFSILKPECADSASLASQLTWGYSSFICFPGIKNTRLSHLPGTYRGAEGLTFPFTGNTLPTQSISSPIFFAVCVLLLLFVYFVFYLYQEYSGNDKLMKMKNSYYRLTQVLSGPEWTFIVPLSASYLNKTTVCEPLEMP